MTDVQRHVAMSDGKLEQQVAIPLPRDEIDLKSMERRGSDQTLGRQNEHTETSGLKEVEAEKAPEQIKEVPPPDGGYGWVVVVCIFWVNAFTWGVNASFAIYLAYYLNNDVFPGTTSLEYAFVGGLSIALALFIAPLATALTRRFTFRLTMLLGIALQCGGLIGASFATKIWHLFLSQGVAFGFGMGLIFVATFGITSQWFLRRRGMANGIVTSGSGIGGIIWSLGTNAIIRNISLQWAFRITAICCFVVNTTAAIVLKDRNKFVRPNQKPFDIKILVRPEYILVMLWGVFSMLGYIVLLYSLPDYALAQGLSSSQSSIVGAMLSLGIMFGRPMVGYFSDAVGRINMTGGATLFTAFTVFAIWIPARTYGVCVFFALITGAVCGTFWATAGTVSAEVVGLVELPSALSLLWLAVVFPCTFSEPIALELRKGTGPDSYRTAQVFTGVMYIIAAFFMFMVRAWKIGQGQKAKEGADATAKRGFVWWAKMMVMPGKV